MKLIVNLAATLLVLPCTFALPSASPSTALTEPFESAFHEALQNMTAFEEFHALLQDFYPTYTKSLSYEYFLPRIFSRAGIYFLSSPHHFSHSSIDQNTQELLHRPKLPNLPAHPSRYLAVTSTSYLVQIYTLFDNQPHTWFGCSENPVQRPCK